MCDYQGYEFGANYLDSVCIEGYLWDADSGGPGELLTHGGDDPCPQCNHATWREHRAETIEEDAWMAMEDGEWPFKHRPKWPQDLWWMRWHQAVGVAMWLRDFVLRRR
jgi:hypothetical protein